MPTKANSKTKKTTAGKTSGERSSWNPAVLWNKVKGIRWKRMTQDEKVHFTLGLVLLVVTLYLTISLLSYFVTGAADQSLVAGKRISQLSDKAAANSFSLFSAWISEIILNRWFGISSLFLAFWSVLAALRLMRVRMVSLLKSFVYCAFLFIWVSLFFGLIIPADSQWLFLAGAHGYHLSHHLIHLFGVLGVSLFLLLTLLIFMVFAFSWTMPFLRDLLQLSFLKKKQKTLDEEAPEEENNHPMGEDADLSDDWEDEGEDGAYEEEDEEKPSDQPSITVTWTNPFDESGAPGRNGGRTVACDTDDVSESATEPVPGVVRKTMGDSGLDQAAGVSAEDIPVTIQVAEASDEPAADEETPGNHDAAYHLLEVMGEYDPKADLSRFKNPDESLLADLGDAQPVLNNREQEENQKQIIQVLESFGIRIQSINGTVGPTVTLYEIVPAPGIRISRIKSLENDIALSLAALGIRIIAPIPGKGTIGIEVPSRTPKVVSMKSLIHSRRFQESKYDLPIVLGKTIENEVFSFDLCKAPHLLVAGATGQGKSVGLNVILTSLLYKKHPAELKIVLVDPKMVEFGLYAGIDKHYLAKVPGDGKPIITESDKVIATLQSLTVEMDDRYRLLQEAGCRNIKEYNEKFCKRRLNPEKGHHFLPYIVIIIDEFGDLIMTAGKEIEMPIARIAQKARAVGMHMIIATQRPTTNIITGNIKANFPARLAFKVTSQIDSRTILDAGGAQQLIGKGDCLYSQGSDIVRIQCAFVDTPEVQRIVDFIHDQQGYTDVYELPEYTAPGEDGGGSGSPAGVNLKQRDSLFDTAARMVVTLQQGSTSYLQRKMGIGYNRAGRIMDELEMAGVVGPAEGSKPRQVLIDTEQALDRLLDALNQL